MTHGPWPKSPDGSCRNTRHQNGLLSSTCPSRSSRNSLQRRASSSQRSATNFLCLDRADHNGNNWSGDRSPLRTSRHALAVKWQQQKQTKQNNNNKKNHMCDGSCLLQSYPSRVTSCSAISDPGSAQSKTRETFQINIHAHCM